MSVEQSWLLQYVGSLAINTSMKSLDFETRSMLAKECINRVCESAGLRTHDKKRRTDKRIVKMFSDSVNLQNTGANVTLTVSSSYLSLTVVETGEVIANHEMPNISFASGGDSETLDFVAYVAKDYKYGRACFVLECGGGLAQQVITAIGQAFEVRFKEFLKKVPKSVATKLETNGNCLNNARALSTVNQSTVGAIGGSERDYYNDLPGKMPPDVTAFENLEHKHKNRKDTVVFSQPQAAPRTCVRKYINATPDPSPNLIDLTSELPPTQTLADCSSNLNTLNFPPPSTVSSEHQYVNFNNEAEDDDGTEKISNIRDPFDMQPFNSVLENVGEATALPLSSSPINNTSKNKMLEDLEKEEWYHGPVSRKDSEILVAKDGDFLIRESVGTVGQYVLTGMQNGHRKHLLLVDPEGVVRTKDKTFDSVSHLINYHRDNGLPIISAESVLLLRTPVRRKR